MSDIKMSDVFDLPVSAEGCCITDDMGMQHVGFCTEDQDDAAVRAINSHDKLTARNAELEALIKEGDEYLNTNSMTNIGSGSILHTKFKQALKDNS